MDIKYTQAVEDVTKKFGTSYYFATRFLPADLKKATYALYGFFRVPDEIVDNAPGSASTEMILQELLDWEQAWEQAYQQHITPFPILNLTAEVFHTYHIPYQYSVDFLSAMRQDIMTTRYQNYEQLKEYMYGSAEVVGLIMSYVIKYTDDKALVYARKLGEAMQMTNFLRDIDEDYRQRQRIYMPQDELATYHITEQMIQDKVMNNDMKKFMKYQVKKTHYLYQEANKGIQYLDPRGRFAVTMASRMYEAILDKIEQQEYNIFLKRARTSKREKIYLLGKTVLELGGIR